MPFIAPFIKALRSLPHLTWQSGDRRRTIPQIVWVASRSVLVSSTVVTGICVGSHYFGGLEPLELAVFDRFAQLQPDHSSDPRLLIITVTEQDLHRYGWPLSDQVLAQSLQQLQSYSPRTIGLDLYRDLDQPPGEAALQTQLQAENVFTITNVIDGIPPPPHVESDRVGFNDLTLDADGVLRRNLLFVAASNQDYYSFALRVSLAYLKQEGILFQYNDRALFLGEVPIVPIEPTAGGYQTADARGYQILLRYRNRGTAAPTLTLSQLLDSRLDPRWVKDKIVLIGTSAPSLKDSVHTPYSAEQHDAFQMPGVVIHAQMTSQLLDIALGNEGLFQFWSQGYETLWLWAWTVIGGMLVWWLRHPLAFGLGGLFCVGVIGGTGWILFGHLIWIPVAEPVLGLVSAMSLAMAHRLFFITTRDALTGLINRTTLIHQLRRSLTPPSYRSAPQSLGVMVLHLDRFQLIEKSLGDPLSDRLLLDVINRLKKVLPRSARLAQLSRDEFAIAYRPKNQLSSLADQLQNALKEPFLLNQQQILITASIGIVMTQDNHTYTAENLLRDAHTAMYRARSLGEARYEVFATGMMTETVDRFTLESDLRQGIIAEEFVLYYQPIVSLKTEEIVGFEALVRWQHPKKGVVSPLMFIPLAEETGLIIPLGMWICEEACRQAKQWQTLFPERSLMVSINLSARQFEQPDLTDQLARIVQESGIKELTLKLEITESMVMGDVEAAIDLMLRLKALDCQLGMDDFGTGYSSLNHLRRFPIDTLKIDRSFIQQMSQSREDREIVRTIISLGHTLGMDLIAEGVETQDQADMLRSLNCEFGQGYLWAKPLPVQDATALLRPIR